MKFKKGALFALPAAGLIVLPVIAWFVIALLFGVSLTGVTVFIVQNGKLLAILLALLIAFNLFKGKK